MRDVASAVPRGWGDAVGGRSCTASWCAPWLVCRCPHDGCRARVHTSARPATRCVERTAPGPRGTAFRRGPPRPSSVSLPCAGPYAEVMSPSRRLWVELVKPRRRSRQATRRTRSSTGPRTGRDRLVDAAGCLLAAALGALFLSPNLHDSAHRCRPRRLSSTSSAGRWPASRCGGGGAGRSASRSPVSCWGCSRSPPPLPGCSRCSPSPCTAPSGRCCSSPRCGSRRCWSSRSTARRPTRVSVVLLVTPLVLAATAWGMFVRARRQLLLTLRERALRAEADQRLHEDRARMAERTRIAREMHDVLAHRISLLALHAGALEVRPDLPPEKVRETAELLRSTARQALEELRGVIGVLREEPGRSRRRPAPQPTLSDIPRLVEETRRAGAKIDFEMRVDHAGRRTERAGTRRLPHRAGGAHQHRQARQRHGGPGAGHRRARRRPARQRPQPPARPRATPVRRCRVPAPACSGCRNGSPSPAAPSCTARTDPATSWWTPSCSGDGEGAAGRRRRPGARRAADDPVLGRGPRGRGRGRTTAPAPLRRSASIGPTSC